MQPIFFEGHEYRPVPNCPKTFVSVSGDMITTKPVNGRGPDVLPRRMNHWVDKYGYIQFSVSNRRFGGRWKISLHVALLTAWHRMPLPGEEGRHLDDNKMNNSLSNLAWGTLQQNAGDKVRNGSCRGERNGGAKLTEADVIRLRQERIHKPMWTIVNENPQWSKFAVWAAVTGYTWGHLPGAVSQGRNCSKEGWKSGIKCRGL